MITWDEWEATYKPTTEFQYEDLFDIDGNVDQHYIWTVVDGDGIYMNIVSGIHFVNRLGYFVTEVPWEDDVFVTNDKRMYA
jgi:hypothetical protein